MKLRVGNVSNDTSQTDLRKAFEVFGQVDAVVFATNNLGGKPKASAFVEMPSKSEAVEAMYEMDGGYLKGSRISVSMVSSEANRVHRGASADCGGSETPKTDA